MLKQGVQLFPPNYYKESNDKIKRAKSQKYCKSNQLLKLHILMYQYFTIYIDKCMLIMSLDVSMGRRDVWEGVGIFGESLGRVPSSK